MGSRQVPDMGYSSVTNGNTSHERNTDMNETETFRDQLMRRARRTDRLDYKRARTLVGRAHTGSSVVTSVKARIEYAIQFNSRLTHARY